MYKKYVAMLVVLLTIFSTNLMSSQKDAIQSEKIRLYGYINNQVKEFLVSNPEALALNVYRTDIFLERGNGAVGEVVASWCRHNDGTPDHVHLVYKMSKNETEIMDKETQSFDTQD
jgi:hypothetical protein